jgi:anti-sigma28 factor (negative regulator of flagellin synthesis)
MSISAISSGSVAAAYAAPVQQAQQAKAPQSAPVADTVSLSKQAQKLASDGDTQAQEVRESGAERGSEKARGRA